MCLLGLAVAVVVALVPVRVDFGGDPLLRLRELDPELSPPPTEAVCGSPVVSLDVELRDTSLYERARARACQDAARRRLATAVAAGAVIVVSGLIGLAAMSRPRERVPRGSGGGGLPSG